jgi:hypothetical protein
LKRFTDNDIDRRTVTRYTIRHNLLTLKHMRKVSWRLMMKVTLRGIAMFVKSQFEELRISKDRVCYYVDESKIANKAVLEIL